MKKLGQITLTIGVTVLGIFLLWTFRDALALFGGSLAISAALRPSWGISAIGRGRACSFSTRRSQLRPAAPAPT